MNNNIKKTPTLEQVLKKMKLSEDEANVFFQHFAKRYLNEECYIETTLDSSINFEGEAKYATIGIQVVLNAQGDELLTSHNDCVIRIN